MHAADVIIYYIYYINDRVCVYVLPDHYYYYYLNGTQTADAAYIHIIIINYELGVRGYTDILCICYI